MNKLNKFSRATIAIAIMFCVALPTFAHHFEVNGIYYDITNSTNKTVAVTYRGTRAYAYSNEYIGSVTFPSSVTYSGTTYSVTSIGDSAFCSCSGLTSIAIPNSVTEIGNSAFDDCDGLTSVTIPNSVTSIGDRAFDRCTGLTSVTIGNSVTTIGDDAFYGCSGLNEVNFNAENCTSMGKGSYSVFEYCSNLKTINIGNEVKTIPNYAFYGCTGLTSVTIPNSVTSIGDEAFGSCSGLSSVNFNAENCTSMGKGSYSVFEYCSNLKTINIGNSVKTIPNYAFRDCTGLTSITIPNSVTSIGYWAFRKCTGLTSITIPNSVTSIGERAFEDCTGLTSVTIPNSVTSIGYNPLYNTGWYKNQPDGILYLDNCCLGYKGNKPTGTLSIKEGTRLIGSYAFSGCTGLTSVTIPNSVTSIGEEAFFECEGLTSITIPNSVTAIGDRAFFWCEGLTEVTIPNSVISIGSSAFYGCSGLTSVTIPNSVTSIGSNPFSNTGWYKNQPDGILYLDNCCLGYKGNKPTGTLSIKEGTRLIAGSAFEYCRVLTSITIPNSVTSIGNLTFYDCTGLTSVTIPNSVTSIGDNAFWGCNKLISSEIIDKTQTTVSIALATPTKYQTGITTNENEQIISESNNIFIKGLKPNTKYTYNYSLIFNDIFCDINSFSFTTNNLVIKNTDIIGVTSASSKAYCEGDVSVIECGINWENSSVEYNNLDSISAYNLDPNTTYYVYYLLNTKEGGEYSTSWSITTKILSWNAGEFTATSTTSARLSVETNCDATEGTGYEWIRYDAPNNLTPNKAPCPIVNGMLRGSLRGLNSNVYYKCRPYYTSSSGKTHYGAWFTIFTGDTNVYFEPEVSTSDNTVVNNTAIINGYALAGSDDILEQGFEYWNASATPSAEGSMGIMTVKASGISMSATITNLNYNSTYRYRAFAKTANGTFYGSEKEFTTSNDQSGVESFESDVINAIEVARYDIHGRLLSEPARGINIIKMSDGTTRKEIVK